MITMRQMLFRHPGEISTASRNMQRARVIPSRPEAGPWLICQTVITGLGITVQNGRILYLNGAQGSIKATLKAGPAAVAQAQLVLPLATELNLSRNPALAQAADLNRVARWEPGSVHSGADPDPANPL